MDKVVQFGYWRKFMDTEGSHSEPSKIGPYVYICFCSLSPYTAYTTANLVYLGFPRHVCAFSSLLLLMFLPYLLLSSHPTVTLYLLIMKIKQEKKFVICCPLCFCNVWKKILKSLSASGEKKIRDWLVMLTSATLGIVVQMPCILSIVFKF